MLRLLRINAPPPFPQLSSRPTFLNLSYFTTNHSTLNPTDELDPSSSLTLHFLKNSCGLPHATALSASKKVRIKTTKTPHSVLSLLKSYNFTQPHIAKIVTRNPKILLANPTNIIKPKLDFLQSIGFSGPHLFSLLNCIPQLLKFSLENKLVHNYNLLKSHLRTEANVVLAVRSSPLILTKDLDRMLIPAVKAHEEYGVPMNVLLRLLTMHVKSLAIRPTRFEEIFEAVKKIGISPKTPIFAHAFGVLGRLTEPNWREKVENFKGFGWTEEQVLEAFVKHPYCMTVSSDKLAKNMEVFMGQLGWDAAYISAYPVVLSFGFQKRIVPRLRVINILKSKGMIEGRVTARHFMLGEKEFLTKFVLKYYDQVPELADDDAIKGKMEDLLGSSI